MASKGRDVPDGASVPVSKDVKVSGANSKRPNDGNSLASKVSQVSIHEHVCDHGRKNKAVPENSQPQQERPQPQPQPARPRPVRKERLEDVFQDEIIKRFTRMSDFKKFAVSKDGLQLSAYDVETIIEDYRYGEEQRMQMLTLWRQKLGKNATVQKIRDVVDGYFKAQEEPEEEDDEE